MNLSFTSPISNKILFKKDEFYFLSEKEKYPIENQIPRFVPKDNYSGGFGLQWNTFRLTQLDSYSETTISEDRLRLSFGFDLKELKGKTVLEAGCGAGRFTEILLKYGAVVYSFDLSNAVEANWINNKDKGQLVLFQGDIMNIPFEDNSFDFVLCLGVLQHTPSTIKSLQSLYRVLKPGGKLVTDHYKYHAGMFTSLYLVYWFIIRFFSVKNQLIITDNLTNFFFPIHWKFKENNLVQMLLRRISPINFYYPKFPLTKELHYEWSKLDTHDRNTDYYKRHVTKSGYEKMLNSLPNSAEIIVKVGGTGYLGCCIKAK